MRSRDTCIWMSVCESMCVRGVSKIKECKLFNRLMVGYGRKCRDACKCVSMNILEIVHQINI